MSFRGEPVLRSDAAEFLKTIRGYVHDPRSNGMSDLLRHDSPACNSMPERTSDLFELPQTLGEVSCV